ncbi:MAG TPA: hypothetical protein VJB66_01395 [Candidatus Nanoarchaeia archaeon]|nr:hypothetical protein [Candidatus Nanoarchaeia archaeon]
MSYTLHQIIDEYKPVRRIHSSDVPLHLLSQPPTFDEWRRLGELCIGEIALECYDYVLQARYGSKRHFEDRPELLCHNHGDADFLPSWQDAEASIFFKRRTEWIAQINGMAQVRYSDSQPLPANHLYGDAIIYSRMELPEGECALAGSCTVTFLPWHTFEMIYTPEKFWTLFDRRRSWAKMMQELSQSIRAQMPELHPEPRQHSAVSLHAHDRRRK